MTWSQHRGGMDGMELRFIANNRQLLSKNLNQLVLSVGLFSGAIKELGALHRGLEKFLCSDPMTEQRGKNHSFKKKKSRFLFLPSKLSLLTEEIGSPLTFIFLICEMGQYPLEKVARRVT